MSVCLYFYLTIYISVVYPDFKTCSSFKKAKRNYLWLQQFFKNKFSIGAWEAEKGTEKTREDGREGKERSSREVERWRFGAGVEFRDVAGPSY